MRVLALLVPLAAAHLYFGWCLSRLARGMGVAVGPWPWVPVLNLTLPFHLAGRSRLWAATLLLPPVNLFVWALVWAELAARQGRRGAWGLWLTLPGVNVVALGRLAGLRPAAIGGAAAALVLAGAAGAGAAAFDTRRQVDARVRQIRTGVPGERLAATQALGRLGTAAAVAALAQALRDDDVAVRRQAAAALETRGRDAGAAAPDLLTALADPEGGPAAARALTRVAPEALYRAPAATTVPPLLAAARGHGEAWLPDPLLVRALAAHGGPGVPALLEGLRDPDAGVRWHAAAALMHVGAAPSAVPGILAAMNDDVWVVRNAAGRALEDVAAPESLPALAAAAADPSVETRYHAVRAIGRQGVAAASVLPTLTAALRDVDWEVRSEAARALGGAAQAAQAAAPALGEAARDADPQVRVSALWALWQVGGAGTRDAAREALQDGEREVRDAALDVLARMERGQ